MMRTLGQIRSLQLLLRVLGTVFLIAAFVRPWQLHPWIFLGFCLLCFGISTHLDYRKWRCPTCGKHLGKKQFPFPTACPHCGSPLKKEDAVP